MAIDPICGMTMDEASALRAERDGQTFYGFVNHGGTLDDSGLLFVNRALGRMPCRQSRMPSAVRPVTC